MDEYTIEELQTELHAQKRCYNALSDNYKVKCKNLLAVQKELDKLSQTYNKLIDNSKIKADNSIKEVQLVASTVHLPLVAAVRKLRALMHQDKYLNTDNDIDRNQIEELFVALLSYECNDTVAPNERIDYLALYNESLKTITSLESKLEYTKIKKHEVSKALDDLLIRDSRPSSDI